MRIFTEESIRILVLIRLAASFLAVLARAALLALPFSQCIHNACRIWHRMRGNGATHPVVRTSFSLQQEVIVTLGSSL